MYIIVWVLQCNYVIYAFLVESGKYWVADWHIRDETYSKALSEVVNFHIKIPFSAYWGDGKTSSSDGHAFLLFKKERSLRSAAIAALLPHE